MGMGMGMGINWLEWQWMLQAIPAHSTAHKIVMWPAPCPVAFDSLLSGYPTTHHSWVDWRHTRNRKSDRRSPARNPRPASAILIDIKNTTTCITYGLGFDLVERLRFFPFVLSADLTILSHLIAKTTAKTSTGNEQLDSVLLFQSSTSSSPGIFQLFKSAFPTTSSRWQNMADWHILLNTIQQKVGLQWISLDGHTEQGYQEKCLKVVLTRNNQNTIVRFTESRRIATEITTTTTSTTTTTTTIQYNTIQ